MDEMMCGMTGQKELSLLKGRIDQSNGDGLNIMRTGEHNVQAGQWPSEEVCTICFICSNLIYLTAEANNG